MNHRYKYLGVLKNERGGMAALLSVVVLSLIMVSTLSSFYIYLENRAKFQERIRMNYQIGYVMEDLGRAVAQARQQRLDNVCTDLASGMRFLDCTEVCTVATSSLVGVVPAGTPSRAICVKNDTLNKIVNNADYFCVYNSDASAGTAKPATCGALAANDSLPIDDAGATAIASHNYKKTKINSWYSRLDNFFDTTIVKSAPVLANKMYPILESKIQPPTLLGWILPQAAYAVSDTYCQKYPQDPVCKPSVEANASVGGGTLDACITNPDESCKEHCTGTIKPAFCKSLDASTKVAQIGGVSYDGGFNCGNGAAYSSDTRCKKCRGLERNNGECLKISVCPPWIRASSCVGNAPGSDMRIHQMVRIE